MRSFERYTIDFSHKTEPGGTHEKPKLLAITSGERTGDSLVFHFKIGTFYQQMHGVNRFAWAFLLDRDI